ncbi:patatin-like phospholipase family protein [Bacillus sp. FJAT-44742]|uniref:patatin-like phospholipase family protein n=1 Tax=Bacillus sp. FJAT-44742 TaxID=2014005 RepID=UPI000C24DE2B|nr:patatin-like phospholipase family protein [Bacillus sp. FJAT-44742]
MNIDGVFAGGGAKAFAFIGAIQVVEERGYCFQRLAGTSAGAITASFIKAGYTSEEILHLLNSVDLKTFLDETWLQNKVPLWKWISVYWKLGLYKGDELEKWIDRCLEAKGIKTFGDLPEGSLKIIASDLTKGRLLVLPDDLPLYGVIPETFSVARAVRMSCSLPYFFKPVKLYGKGRDPSIVVDGGLLSNFPIWIFIKKAGDKPVRPVIGFQLTPSLEEIREKKIRNAFDMYQSLFETMRNAHDMRYITKTHAKNIVFIPVHQIKATDFHIDDIMKKKLMEAGKMKTKLFLKDWI